MDQWAGDIAIVAGGASGLGAATATALAGLGLRPAVLDLDEAAGSALADRIGGRVFGADVADAAAVAAAIDRVADWGRIRVAVNCAGIAPAAKTVSRGAAHDPATFERVVRVNLIGSFTVASCAAAHMTATTSTGADGARGVIVNTASVAAFDGQVGQAAYAASKAGIVGLTLPMARDLADKGIRVCAIAPGLFATPLLDGLPDEVRASLEGQAPFPARLGDPEEFAALVCHIVRNPMLNGEVIRLDGAIRMAAR